MTTVKSTQQITKAMKMVSAAKLRRAQDKIVKMRPYAQKLHKIMSGLSDSIDGSEVAAYYEERKVENVLFVVVSSDRGLCGAFNSSLIKEMKRYIDNDLPEFSGKIDLYSIGKRGREGTVKFGYDLAGSHDGFFQNFDWAQSEEIADKLLSSYRDGTYDRIYVVYNEFKNAATYFNTVSQLLPVVSEGAEEEGKDEASDFIFEPSQAEILNDLVPRSLKTTFFKALLDSNASEHGARMTAMDNATENAQDLLRRLSIEYNKARQAAITTEILEIVGGAEALASG